MPSHRRATRLAGLCASERACRLTCSRYVRGVALLRSAGSGLRCLALLIRAGAASLCRFGVTLLHSAPGQGVSRPPHTASRDCRNGSPLARAIPCAPAPECGDTQEKEKAGKRRNEKRNGSRISARAPTRSAASRAVMAGWAGEGGGRFGERREYEAPTLPSTPRQHGMARHHKSQERDSSSTVRLATTTVSRETARNHTRQPRNSSPPSPHPFQSTHPACEHPAEMTDTVAEPAF